MPDPQPQTVARFTILCRRCDRPLVAPKAWVGREVQCPHCDSLMRVPELPADGRPVQADGPNLSVRYCFNFACPRCECLLEAHTGMSGQVGTCPTCGGRFSVPHARRRSGKLSKPTPLDDEVETPVPIHAYAASGHQAPQIVRRADGTSVIQCPRCNAHNPVDAETCTACGTPFTMEAASTIGKLHRDRRATSSVVFGIVALLLFFTIVPGVLATWLGLRSVMFTGSSRLSVPGLVGLTLGLLSLVGGVVYWYWKLQ